MATKYDDALSLKEIYASEDQAWRAVQLGGPIDFHGSMLDLSNCRVMQFRPSQLPIMQGAVVGLYARHRDPLRPERAPTLRISERAAGGRAWYSRAGHEIVLPRVEWAFSMAVLLHELGHAVTGTGHNQRTSHGREWRKSYVALVADAVGPEASLLLAEALNL